MTASLISIFMPVKNAEKYLKLCIDSIIEQSHVNWELIAIDDHSDDSSVDVLQEFALKEDRIKVHSNKGKGIQSALKLALSYAQGTFITRMDADDLMHPRKLELLHSSITVRPNISLALCLVEYFSDSELGAGYRAYDSWINDVIKTKQVYTHIYKECSIPSCAWMMKRQTIEDLHLFNHDVIPEDYEFAFRCFENAVEYNVVSEPLHLWRDHPERTSRNSEQYDIRSFGPFKLNKFLHITYDESKELIVYGAGSKAKELVGILKESDKTFTWVTGNRSKVGHQINGIEVQSAERPYTPDQVQIIICISNKTDLASVEHQLQSQGLRHGTDYFVFF